MLEKQRIKKIRVSLLEWGRLNYREYIWRMPKPDPYLLVITEMLLRKTQAHSAEPVIKKLYSRYPTVFSLKDAICEELEAIIRPVGLFHIRAYALIEVAKMIVNEFAGEVPSDFADLARLPHLGRYACNAILCFAFDQPRAIVDANVVRIYSRVFSIPIPIEVHKAENYWNIAQRLLPKKNFKEFNWALLDLGAMLCKPHNPKCCVCPLSDVCLFGFSSSSAKQVALQQHTRMNYAL